VSTLKTLARKHLPRPVAGALRARGQGVRFLLKPDFARRWDILGRFQQVSDGVRCEHGEGEVVRYAEQILALPDTVEGCIAECGCYLGGSSAKLSVVARAVGRRLVVFDSFMGLPAEDGRDEVRYAQVGGGAPVPFRRGDYTGTLEQVKAAVARLGEPGVVEYVPGFFAETLPHWEGKVAAVVMDVDLVSSTRDVLTNLWPRLSPGGVVFSQDGHLREVCALLASRDFWAGLGEPAPPEWVGLGREKVVYAHKR
jgi:O-methyltransferase